MQRGLKSINNGYTRKGVLCRFYKENMKTLILSFILFLMSFSVMAQTAELPEPTEIDWKYKARILWGSILTTSVWQDQEITWNIVDGVVAEHKYSSRLGTQVWESAIPNNDPLKPKKVIFTFVIDKVPTEFKLNFYRVKLIAYQEPIGVIADDDTNWSISNWVLIYGTGKSGAPENISR